MKWKKISTFKSFCKQKNFDVENFDKWSKNKQITLWKELDHFNINLNDINKSLTSKLSSIPPYQDHVVLFKSSVTGFIYYTFQAYYEAACLEIQMQEWSRTNNLSFKIYPQGTGWHNKNNTTLIVITLK